MKVPCDRTSEVKAAAGNLEVGLNDYCDYFKQDTTRLFSNRECWYCKHADFGINTEHPKKNGVCRYKTTINGILDSFAKRCECNPAIQARKKIDQL